MNEKQKSIGKFTLSFLLLLAAYIPTFIWMWGRWMAEESYYGHGIIIPVISGYIIWQRKEKLKEAKMSNAASGLFIIALGLLIHAISALLKIYFISGFSFVLVLYGLTLFFFGKEVKKNLIFPISFLLTMIPLPLVLIGNLTVKLKLFAAQCAVFVLNRIGFPSMLDGSLIRMPNSFTSVGAPCSGLRSLIALLTLGLVFSFFMKVSYLKKGFILLAAVPIAIVTNVIRIVMLSAVNDLYGEEAATGFFHDFSGFLVFALAFIGLFIVGRKIEGKENEE